MGQGGETLDQGTVSVAQIPSAGRARGRRMARGSGGTVESGPRLPEQAPASAGDDPRPDPPAETSAPARKISPLAVAGWVSYDLGNTIFSFNIVSIYLPLWVVNDMGGRDSDY